MEAKVDEKEKKKKKENDERDTNEPEVKTLLQREFTVSSVPYTESNEEEPKTHWEEVSVKSCTCHFKLMLIHVVISCHSAPPEFWKAIDVKDLTAVKEYVEDNFSLVAAIDEYGERALHRCIYVNALEIVELLIDKGADLHIIVCSKAMFCILTYSEEHPHWCHPASSSEHSGKIRHGKASPVQRCQPKCSHVQWNNSTALCDHWGLRRNCQRTVTEEGKERNTCLRFFQCI